MYKIHETKHKLNPDISVIFWILKKWDIQEAVTMFHMKRNMPMAR